LEQESSGTMYINSCTYIRIVSMLALCVLLLCVSVYLFAFCLTAFADAMVHMIVAGDMPWTAWFDLLSTQQISGWWSVDGAVMFGVCSSALAAVIGGGFLAHRGLWWVSERIVPLFERNRQPDEKSEQSFTDVIKARWVDKMCVELEIPPAQTKD
jgi:hypothetical protein